MILSVQRVILGLGLLLWCSIARADDVMDHFIDVKLSFAATYEGHLPSLEYIEKARVTGIERFCAKGVQFQNGHIYCELFYGGRRLWVREGRPTIANIVPAMVRDAVSRLPFRQDIGQVKVYVGDLNIGRSGIWELEANFSKADVRIELLDAEDGVIDSFEGSKTYLLKNEALSKENYVVDGASVHYSTSSIIAMALFDAFSSKYPDVEFRGVQVFGTVARPRTGFINRPKVTVRGDTP